MSFFTNIRRVFGLADDTEAEPQYLDDETVNASPAKEPEPTDGATSATGVDVRQTSCASTPSNEAEAIAAEMLAGVVDLFNAFQPEFIAQSLDPEKQKEILADKMTPALKARLEALAASRRQAIEDEAKAERVALDANLKRMRDRNAELERRRSEFKNEQLSAQRQKRALQERIHDLETQVEQLSADKEQLELETRSMANKMRVAGVAASADETTPQPVNSELEANLEAALKAQAETLRSIEVIQADNNHLKTAIEALKERCKVADEMISGLRHRAAEAESSAEKAQAKAMDMEKIMKEAETNADQLREQMVELQKQVKDSAISPEELAKKDARIAELKQRLSDAKKVEEAITRLEQENRTLKDTIQANLYEHAAQVSSLRRELEVKTPKRGRPRKKPIDPHAEEVKKEKRPSTAKITAIDELIEESEWLVAPTPEELKPQMVEEPSDDFGYRPPTKKLHIPDDENQLTLF
ncbi:MAG: hypothetical protein NC342_05135 [Pseudoflavonifractor sp.]|nr:hypothetical protein [Alloprevotella sp.]MCM1116903.1 hypothetical protein [Pseudoflavonifractor sp.]